MTQPSSEEPTRTYFEDVLPHTGWGLYHKFMITMACVSCFAQAVAFFGLPFSIALSTCKYSITEDMIHNFNIVFNIARAFGGLLLTVISDIYGRKRLLTDSMLLIFFGTFMAAFAYNYHIVMVSAVILATGLETNFCVVRVHLAEVLPLNKRGCYLAICDISWCFGYILASSLGIFLKTPPTIEITASAMQLTYWRMILAIAGGLNITIACATALLEESPRYFLHIKKNYLAVLTLKQFYAINKSSYGEYLEVKESDLVDIINDEDLIIYPEPHGCTFCKRVISIMYKTIAQLFSNSYIKTTMLLVIIKIPLLMLEHMKENIMLTKYSNSANYTESLPKNGIDVMYLETLRNQSLCFITTDFEALYQIYFLLITGVLLGIHIVVLLVDRIGRKFLSCGSLLMCCACYLSLFIVHSFTPKIILSTVFMTSFAAALTTVTIINIESYPTALRCTSWSISNFPGLMISTFIIKYFYSPANILSNYFFVIHGTLFFGAAMAAYFLVDLKKKPMIE